jgi:hypothetical protein
LYVESVHFNNGFINPLFSSSKHALATGVRGVCNRTLVATADLTGAGDADFALTAQVLPDLRCVPVLTLPCVLRCPDDEWSNMVCALTSGELAQATATLWLATRDFDLAGEATA